MGCIYAVLAVDLFGYAASVTDACPPPELRTIDLTNGLTGRARCWGDEYFGSFFRSLYTLFQVLTCESWSEMVVRPLFSFFTSPYDQFFSGVFFVSFIMVNGIVLINVVVAVLLDKMAAAETDDANSSTDAQEDETKKEEQKKQKVEARKAEIDDLGSEIKMLSDSSRQDMQAMRAQIDGLNEKVLSAMEKLNGLAAMR